MDWYPLYNSLRIAAASTALVFLLGIALANLVAKTPRVIKGLLDVILTLPLVLPPTVVGYLLLLLLGPRRPIGRWVMDVFGIKLTMVWYAAIFATVVVSLPLMYRTARGAFESFDETLADAARTLGKSNTWVFWHIKMPCCMKGVVAGTVLAFARALGEYGATSMICGYTPNTYQQQSINYGELATMQRLGSGCLSTLPFLPWCFLLLTSLKKAAAEHVWQHQFRRRSRGTFC